MTTRRLARYLVSLFAVVALLFAAGCSSDDNDNGSSSSEQSGDAVEASDGWVKAVPAGSKMTGVFVNLKNVTDEPIEVVSATTDMSDMTELHETVEKDGSMMMQKTDKFSISDGGTLTLEPGGYHIMVMNLQKEILAGEKYQVTLVLSNGDHVEFEAVAKDFSGANESYHHTPEATPSA